MKAFHVCLIVGATFSLPLAAAAQSAADYRYCSALSDKFQGFTVTSSRITQAIEKCRNGKSAEAIPVLEAALHDANVALPPREQAVLGVTKRPFR